MIANARMYSVSPVVAELWRTLLAAVIAQAGVSATLIEHAAPAPLEELWSRTDQGAVFMCGLPFSRAQPQPRLVAAPVPSPAEFGGKAQYWSDLVVRNDSPFGSVDETFGKRIAFTVPDSQSGYAAALSYFMSAKRGAPASAGTPQPLYGEVIAPAITPLGALRAVTDGAADIAPIDSYAFRLLQAYRPDLTSQVRILARTAPTPIPPLVASPSAIVASPADLDALQSAFLNAHRSAATRRTLGALLLERFVRPDASAYAVLRERFAAATRYWTEHSLAAVVHPAFAHA
ncbi:MAG: PhnD/SsuA/transferrin family substrate-binding protein [Pseudomonadota bacterium]|nr:PhnD/SsuA/transferrin family substrate-binding protein [Pseudomonadota bacterium]